MKLVVDTSAFLAVVLGEERRAAILDTTRGANLSAPDVLPFEVGNALSAMVRRGRISAEQAAVAWQSFSTIPVQSRRCDIGSALELAAEQGIYAYDAYFLETARRHRLPLLTLDRGMLELAQRLAIDTLETDS
ncbi:type II toxin-antitoxin system VapC family toxin [Wenzhouxiangella sp. XN79A]|nr:type II toxin-antitoxin system VapC family toxin [Wenzhouxiangella sp. XN79A]